MKTIVRRLLALGVPIQQAVGLGRSRKKWWGHSMNPVINKALSDKYLANQGLISIKDLWAKVRCPVRTRMQGAVGAQEKDLGLPD